MRRSVVVFAAVVIAGLMTANNFHSTVATGAPGFAGWKGSDRVSEIERRGDAQAVVLIAQGRHVDRYWLRRPVPIAADYIVALGQKQWMPYAMVPLTLFGVGLLVYALYGWFGAWALLILLVPAVRDSLNNFMPLAAGAGLIGWQRKDWRWLALGGLAHETLLLFALHRRKPQPFILYGSWALTAGLLWGFRMNSTTVGFLASYGARPAHPVLAVVTLALGVVGMIWGERWLSALFLGLALCLGQSAWTWWGAYSRILLPLWIFGALAIFNRLHHYRTARQVPRAADSSDGRDVQLDPVFALGADV